MFFNFGKSKKKRVCLIGLDGVPFTFIDQRAKDGTMPNIASLLQSGNLTQMSVSIPEVSSVSWASFMTGANSGMHGIYGFMDVKDGQKELYFPNYKDLKAETIWQALEKSGKKSAIINLPSTYPAARVNGVLVSGFVAIELEKAVYPASLLPKLKAIEYKIDVRAMLAKDDPEFLFKELDTVLESRFKAFDIIYKMDDWDFFMPVVTGTDRLHHFHWDAIANPNHEHHNACMAYYRRLDEKIGGLIDILAPGTDIMLMSDHGFTTIKKEVYLNKWLEKNGYLSYKTDTPATVQDIDDSSRAFALDPSRIYINKASRFTNGTVQDADVGKLADEIAEKLSVLSCNGEQVLNRFFKPEELYSGDQKKKAPDIILLSNYGYDLKGRIGTNTVFGRSHFTGMHTQDDAHFFSTAQLPASPSTSASLNIIQLKDYILDLVL